MKTTTRADAGALGVLLDLLEETVLPRLPALDRAPYMRAVERARRLKVRLAAGEVLVLTEEEG